MDVISLNYRQAVLLNNIGVALISRKAYSEANDTLKDALVLMKTQTQVTPPSAEQVNLLNASRRVLLASQRLAKFTSLTTSPPDVSLVLLGGSIVHPSENLSSLLQDPRSTSVCPCRIELADFERIEDRNSDLDSAIMLYNFGLVRFCNSMDTSSADPGASQVGYHGAVKLFEMSESILAKCECDDENRLLALSIILHCTVRSLLAIGEYEKAGECWAELLHIQDEVVLLADLGLAPKPLAASAA